MLPFGGKFKSILAMWLSVVMAFLLNSCILDEFKFSEIHLKDEWKMGIVTPMFYGNFTFKDLVDTWDTIDIYNNEKVVKLKSASQTMEIPLRYVYDPTRIITGFNFLIEGDDYLSAGEFIYTVSNGSPFPLNFQMSFYDKNKPDKIGPEIIPPPFLAGEILNDTVIAKETVFHLNLTADQLLSFKNSNRINFTSWFEQPEQTFNTDTLFADYPIKITVVFKGAFHGEYE